LAARLFAVFGFRAILPLNLSTSEDPHRARSPPLGLMAMAARVPLPPFIPLLG